jgi:hypothetical protein
MYLEAIAIIFKTIMLSAPAMVIARSAQRVASKTTYRVSYANTGVNKIT